MFLRPYLKTEAPPFPTSSHSALFDPGCNCLFFFLRRRCVRRHGGVKYGLNLCGVGKRKKVDKRAEIKWPPHRTTAHQLPNGSHSAALQTVRPEAVTSKVEHRTRIFPLSEEELGSVLIPAYLRPSLRKTEARSVF